MYFTPKINSLKEDDGYLMGYVHDIMSVAANKKPVYWKSVELTQHI